MGHETGPWAARYALGDKAAAAELDGLTELAAEICDAATAFVLVADHDRPVSIYGVAPERPQDDSLVAVPPRGQTTEIVVDLVDHPRLGHLAEVEPYVRFYAGLPLLAANGVRLGTLVVLDPAPRRLTQVQRKGLATLARQIELHFELRRQRVYAQLHVEHQRSLAIDELDRARDERDRFFELSLDSMCVVDANGFFVRVNRPFFAMLGFSRDVEMTGLRSIDFVHPEDRARVRELAGGLRGHAGEPQRMEVRYRHRDGSYRVLGWTAVADGRSGDIFAIARDLTEARRLELESRHAQKMEALGRIASGVAHDFNNLLTIIMAASDTIHASLPEGSPLREELDSILEASQNGATLTRQLLTFVRKRPETRRDRVDLGSVAAGVERLVRRTLGSEIQLNVTASGAPWPIFGDPSQLQQVLMNLILNARDALPGGGTIDVRVANLIRDNAELVRLSVIDNGIGMDDATRARIFEPFFTTKPSDRGTGLGLATVFGIVAQHRGTIDVESTPGTGTRFDLEFRKAD